MLVFDFDGVIADSLPHYQAACLHAIKTLGLPITDIQNTFSGLENVNFEALAKLFDTDEQQLADTITKHILSRTTQSPVFAGMPEVITQSAKKVGLHILSAGAEAIAQKVLHTNQLENYFETITGGDQPGSKAEKLSCLADTFNQPPASITMIGDSISDLKAAREFGCREIAVTWGWHSRESLEKLQPEFIAHTPQQLHQIISNIYRDNSEIE